MIRAARVALLMIAALVARRAEAQVERYALIVGNNAGDGDEQRLRYAEDDARRVYDVLRELGGFRAENMLMLRDEDAATVRRALISLNDRIRTHVTGGSQSELLVYYSGHADQVALHLGRTSLDLVELEQLVRGSAASLRLLILDACRSGALTRVKGGAIAPGFAIALDQRIPEDGLIFWTATSASENAQESEGLRGSFFTHYLVSGLLGAADGDGDGSITLGEAYQYAYDNTLRASSRTLSGTQHPTFHYELGGHGEVVLTTLGRPSDQRALVSFPAGKSYLLIRGSEDGSVIAEVGAHDRMRRLSVKPGRYFVRGRGPDFLLEGTLVLRPAEDHPIREQELERLEYARLVRKGHGEVSYASSLQAGYAVRTPLWSAASLCQGPFAGYAADWHAFSLTPRVAVCRGGFDNAFLHATTDELDLELRGAHAWDIGRLALSVGLAAGTSLLRETFSGVSMAPPRNAVAGHLGVLAGATVDFRDGFFAGLEIDAMTYFFDQQASDMTQINTTQISTPFVLRFNALLIGKRW